jgi:hypothetical protein
MIGVLSAVGRAVVVIAAVLTVIGFTLSGYLYAQAREAVIYGNFTISGGGPRLSGTLFESYTQYFDVQIA